MDKSTKEAARQLREELEQAARRIEAGEPFNTTAAELGFTPEELAELFEIIR